MEPEKENIRTCIVTRTQAPPEELIRFVADPQGKIVADLKRRLPGRGVWVGARRETVAEAVRRHLFAKSLKAAVTADESLPGEIEKLLEREALSALSLAKKAGLVRTGADNAAAAIRAGEAVALFQASDAARDSIRKLGQAVSAALAEGRGQIVTANPFSAVQLGLAFGRETVVHAALVKGGASRNAMAAAQRLKRYRGEEDRTPGESRTIRTSRADGPG